MASTPLTLEKSDDSRTFEYILEEDYGSSLRQFCNNHKVDYRTIYYLIHLGITRSSASKTIQAVADLLGSNPDCLFPKENCLQPIFSSIIDTPGYLLLEQKYPLHFRIPYETNLNNLFAELGISRSDYNRFLRLLQGHRAVWTDSTFCQAIANILGVEMDQLFPPNIYRCEKSEVEYKAPPDNLISDNPDAKQYLSGAYYFDFDESGEIRDEIHRRLHQAIDVLPDKKKMVVHQHYGFVCSAKTLTEIGDDLDLTCAAISARKIDALKIIKALIGDVSHDLLQLARKTQNVDRIF